MIDVMVAMPGAGAKEIEERVTRPMEKLLWEIPGVEYLYSTSRAGESLVIVRFKVGKDLGAEPRQAEPEAAARTSTASPRASPSPLIKPQVHRRRAHPRAHVPQRRGTITSRSAAWRPRWTMPSSRCRSSPKPRSSAARGGKSACCSTRSSSPPRNLSPAGLVPDAPAGQPPVHGRRPDHRQPRNGHRNRRLPRPTPRRSATSSSGSSGATRLSPRGRRHRRRPEEPREYVFFGHGRRPTEARAARRRRRSTKPAVTLSVAKRPGANAISVADEVLRKVETLRGAHAPRGRRGRRSPATTARPPRRSPTNCSSTWASPSSASRS